MKLKCNVEALKEKYNDAREYSRAYGDARRSKGMVQHFGTYFLGEMGLASGLSHTVIAPAGRVRPAVCAKAGEKIERNPERCDIIGGFFIGRKRGSDVEYPMSIPSKKMASLKMQGEIASAKMAILAGFIGEPGDRFDPEKDEFLRFYDMRDGKMDLVLTLPDRSLSDADVENACKIIGSVVGK